MCLCARRLPTLSKRAYSSGPQRFTIRSNRTSPINSHSYSGRRGVPQATFPIHASSTQQFLRYDSKSYRHKGWITMPLKNSRTQRHRPDVTHVRRTITVLDSTFKLTGACFFVMFDLLRDPLRKQKEDGGYPIC